MIIGSGTPTSSNPLLCNSELGTFYLDKVNQRLYLRSMSSPNCLQTDWVDISFLISNNLLLKEFNDSLQGFFDKIPYNFEVSNSRLIVTSNDGTFNKNIDLPTLAILAESIPVNLGSNKFNITSGTLEEVVNQLISKIAEFVEAPTVTIQSSENSVIICHRKNLSSIKLEKNVWTDILDFDTLELDTTGKMVLDNTILIPKKGYYLIEGGTTFPTIAQNNAVGIALIVNDKEVDKVLYSTTGVDSQFVKIQCSLNLNKYDTVRMQVYSSLTTEVKKVELYAELKV